MKVRSKPTVNDRLLDESSHPGLSPGRTYFVIGIDSTSFRVINDNGEPILYPKGLFEIVDASIPDGWLTERLEDGEYFIEPPEFAKPGFYERLFDGEQSAVEQFEEFRVRNARLIKTES